MKAIFGYRFPHNSPNLLGMVLLRFPGVDEFPTCLISCTRAPRILHMGSHSAHRFSSSEPLRGQMAGTDGRARHSHTQHTIIKRHGVLFVQGPLRYDWYNFNSKRNNRLGHLESYYNVQTSSTTINIGHGILQNSRMRCVVDIFICEGART